MVTHTNEKKKIYYISGENKDNLMNSPQMEYFKKEKIRVNAISPGGILDSQPKDFLKKYNQQCLTKGMLDKQDLNGVLIFLLSDMSRYINGQNIIVDDGFSL